MKLLLFVGAGTSVELGVPAMRRMAVQFRDHLHDSGLPSEIIGVLDERLRDDSFDIENIIDELDKLAGAIQVAPRWGTGDLSSQSHNVTVVRSEAEWFIQHVCERIEPGRARQLWRGSLNSLQPHNVTIATTNYDRAVELAAIESGISLRDGFEPFASNESAKWSGLDQSHATTLLKLHGSTDWYKPSNEETLWKLRHSMALFGGVTLNLGELALGHAIVLPSREKAVTEFPFGRLHYEFRRRAEEADATIFLGTSLRDPHILSVCKECAQRSRTFIVSPGISDDDPQLPLSAKKLRQTAGRFLISTLPNALRNPDFEAFAATLDAQPDATEPLLEWLVTASDDTKSTKERCDALDDIASASVPLEKAVVESFLNEDDARVNTYALGLVQDSPDRDYLVNVAQRRADKGADDTFCREVQLLLTLLGEEAAPGTGVSPR